MLVLAAMVIYLALVIYFTVVIVKEAIELSRAYSGRSYKKERERKREKLESDPDLRREMEIHGLTAISLALAESARQGVLPEEYMSIFYKSAPYAYSKYHTLEDLEKMLFEKLSAATGGNIRNYRDLRLWGNKPGRTGQEIRTLLTSVKVLVDDELDNQYDAEFNEEMISARTKAIIEMKGK